MNQTVIVFKDKATADLVAKEIAATPFGGVWLWYQPEEDRNEIVYLQGADGRCAMCHPFSESDRAWLEVYLEEFIASGDVQILDAVPADWRYPAEVD